MTKSYLPQVEEHRTAAYEIDPVFLNRWSPRSYKEDQIADEVLFSLFEAARWAPSGSNEQPWRFMIARTPEDKQRFYSFIAEGNRIWCEKAPVLALILSKTINSRGDHLRSHAFDAGAAWGYLALEATKKGLVTHAMGGFDPEKAREVLSVPADYELHAVIAIGYQGEKEALPEALQEREKPSSRRELSETVFEGVFEAK
ncbi:nitroreductase family protein [Brevibacillus ruminantium]|uniref:Nitroreductase family protein n=1 Tax=Brevibacillus ruminantium TaxID=2950604 RepID=A0ABY4WGA2_9BACL|nr:nitroreductase family protein [Brevibacillus ruminantium]USG65851.1 nitroreductase family protein [Brevibacillus ruminantium]